ncbi:MAG: FkbM family methyltransferase [Verrucomicrobia bacterium]|nr:FkbM family methyltransferase [Verrucomicrobiota bacterium]
MKIKESIWFFIHHHRRNRAVARLARLCKNIHRASEHPTYDIARNGESAVLARVVSGAAPVLFDVGANVGDWTVMARGHFPRARVHAFELNPATATQLTTRLGGQEGVEIHAHGLGATTGEVSFFAYSGEQSVLSGMRAPLHSRVPHEVKRSRIRTGDEFCRERGVERIDYLKVDAEGADYEVLTGFSEMLSAQRVGAVQFEHEGGRFLRDYYDWLRPRGYVLGKLYANYVDFREHDIDQEHFLGPNYLALPAAREDLIRSLKAGWPV